MVEANGSKESRVDDFAAYIFHLLNYHRANLNLTICERTEMSFTMAGQRVDAKTDVCLKNGAGRIFFVQEDKVCFLRVSNQFICD